MLGTKLGPYEIKEQIGHGGMAVVYRAYQPSVERSVAVKVMTQSIAGDSPSVQRFQREARLIARLEHPYILPIYDFDGGHEPPYIVMRYLEGGTLKDLLRRGSLPLSQVCLLMRQITAAVNYAHRQGIVHRDIKPSNILLDREGNAFVSDFGIARMLASRDDLTAQGEMIGTPDYMSPEQVEGRDDIDHRADIYALGVMLFEMLTSKRPFAADNPVAAMVMRLHSPVPSAVVMNPALPRQVDDVLYQAMARDPSLRYPSAAILMDDFAAAVSTVRPAGKNTTGQAITGAGSWSMARMGTKTIGGVSISAVEQNRVVTILAASAAEYSERVSQKDGSQAAFEAVQRFWGRATEIVEQHTGVVLARTDYDLLAVWGAELAREDNAEQAVRAALAIRSALPADCLAQREPLPVQIGVNTGLALVAPGEQKNQYRVSGAVAGVANRLMQQAQGEVLISHHTYNQVRGIFDVEPDVPLRGRSGQETIPVYRILAAKGRAFRVAMRGVEGIETRMVGREAELRLLRNALLDTLEDNETQMITLVGEAGIGKSRLLYEFDNWIDLHPQRFEVLRGWATPEMTARPYALLRDILSFHYSIYDNDNPPVVRYKLEAGIGREFRPGEFRRELDISDTEMAHLLGFLAGFDVSDSPYVAPLLADPQQLTSRARLLFYRWIAQLCANQPVWIMLEDLQHADNPSLDLFDELLRVDDKLPLLMICTARPVLYERRPAWGSGQPRHIRIDLRRLDRRGSRDLLREILKKMAEIPRPLRDMLVERAEGNPFYLEELVKMLIDDRVIVRENNAAQGTETWHVEETRLNRQEVPATLAGLLQARLDSLLYPERLTLQRAAVVGTIFYDQVLEFIDDADETHVLDLPAVLARLAKSEFIQTSESSDFEGSARFAFSSQLLRDVLLSTLARRQVQTYNQACALWLTQAGAGRLDEYYPLLARFYERSGDLENAACYWRLAGEKSLALGSFDEARAQLELALRMSDDATTGGRPVVDTGLRLQLAEACYYQADFPAARLHLSAALDETRRQEDRLGTADGLYWSSQVAAAEGDYGQAQACLEEGLLLVRPLGDAAALARLLYGLGDLSWRLGEYDRARTACQESLALARQAGHVRRELYALNRLGTVALSQGNLDEAEQTGKMLYTRALQAGNRERAAVALNNLAVVAGERGDNPAAQAYTEQAIAIVRELGQQHFLATLLINQADGYIRLGSPQAARQVMQEGLALARRLKVIPLMLMGARNTGWLLAAQGQVERGLALMGLALYHPAADDESRRNVAESLIHLHLDAADPGVAACLAAGRQLDLDQAIEQMLSDLA